MQLYVDSNFLSPYAISVYVCLRVKDIDFEIKTINLSEYENLDQAYSEVSLTNRIPTLKNGKFSLSESSAIAEYLEEIKPTPHLYPQAIHDRAAARQIQAWLRSDLLNLRKERPTEVIFGKMTKKDLSREAKLASDKLIEVASRLIKKESLHPFGSWTIADIDLTIMLNRLILNNDPVPGFLQDYAKHHWQHPAILEWIELNRQSSL